MTFAELRNLIPDFGRDTRLNLEVILTEEGATGLTQPQIWGVALAMALPNGTGDMTESFEESNESEGLQTETNSYN